MEPWVRSGARQHFHKLDKGLTEFFNEVHYAELTHKPNEAACKKPQSSRNETVMGFHVNVGREMIVVQPRRISRKSLGMIDALIVQPGQVCRKC